MGVKLTELLPIHHLKLEDLKGKKIAVDAPLMIYQFLSSIRQRDGTHLSDSHGNVTSHLVGIFSRVTNLIEKGLKLCFVFDGKAPKLKQLEREKRFERKELAKGLYEKAKQEEDIELMYKYSKQTTRFTPGMMEESKRLISALGLPVVQAPSEAEAQAAFMCRNKDVWAVGTQDADAIVFGATRILRNLTLSKKRLVASGEYVEISPELIELDESLKELKINQDKMISMAILIGTDFNPGGVKGIGPKKALEIVQKEKTDKEIFKKYPVQKWKEIKDLFKNIPTTKDYKLEWGKVDSERIKKILVDEHDFSLERVERTLKKLSKENVKEKELNNWF